MRLHHQKCRIDPRRVAPGLAIFVLTASLLTGPASKRGATATDLHAFWDSRCAECHRHAGEFARNHFKLKDGRLVGRNAARDICAYLVGHRAGETMAAPICAMLTAQAGTPSLFRKKCAECHETAADLARTGLAVAADGTVTGKSNGREIGEFLATHGSLTPDEIPIVIETLKRVVGEIGLLGQ